MKGMLEDPSMRKNLIIMAVVVGVLVIAFGILPMFSGGKSILSYSDMEKKLVEVGQKYYEDNKDKLPKNDGDTKEITADKLVELELMKPISKQLTENATCDGKVVVKKVDDNYTYTAYLDCGKDYKTIELSKKIIEDNTLTTSGDGLYELNGEFIFRGENVNNYVKFADKTWRIIKVDTEGDIKLILDGVVNNVNYDNRYNTENKSSSGINNYVVSRMKENLENIYSNNEVFNDDNRSKIKAKEFCVGKRSETDNLNDGSIECQEKTEKQSIGLITLNEYIYASIDDSCDSYKDKTCQNYNYIAELLDDDIWTMTPYKANTYEMFIIEDYGGMNLYNCSSNFYIKPVIYLYNNLTITSGNGSIDEPYTIN